MYKIEKKNHVFNSSKINKIMNLKIYKNSYEKKRHKKCSNNNKILHLCNKYIVPHHKISQPYYLQQLFERNLALRIPFFFMKHIWKTIIC